MAIDWNAILAIYEARLQTSAPHHSERINRMMGLVSKLMEEDGIDAEKVYVEPLTLNITVPNALRTISIDWEHNQLFSIYMDRCGDTEESFWGQATQVSLDKVVLKLREYIEHINSGLPGAE